MHCTTCKRKKKGKKKKCHHWNHLMRSLVSPWRQVPLFFFYWRRSEEIDRAYQLRWITNCGNAGFSLQGPAVYLTLKTFQKKTRWATFTSQLQSPLTKKIRNIFSFQNKYTWANEAQNKVESKSDDVRHVPPALSYWLLLVLAPYRYIDTQTFDSPYRWNSIRIYQIYINTANNNQWI